ncbi:hypothetical protein [Cecembia lonarensis]|uniref:Uncharacterized protein n=1 Tax=Cecembia lonarensis (strain CCUG 58316 / KCTC 22772 / LW9) TaxID=1225176 RepID=K1KXS3_CECL9|nr:hypothetical protein [Cecembia lonarensis]EKB48920.1 hypothetical protein B879_02488 [Cecembia lonarensis LW9]
MKAIQIKIGCLVLLVGLMMTACIEESINEQVNIPHMEEALALEQFDLFEDEIGQFLRMNPSDQNKLLAQVRRATAKYHRVEVAIEDGYLEASHCVYNDELGAGMGYHFVKGSLVDPKFDPLMPEALLYEKGENGKFKLIGVEYIIIDIGQDHPQFGNHPFDVGGTPVPVDHYSLHVWTWKHNPLGMYFPYNPNVSCTNAMTH